LLAHRMYRRYFLRLPTCQPRVFYGRRGENKAIDKNKTKRSMNQEAVEAIILRVLPKKTSIFLFGFWEIKKRKEREVYAAFFFLLLV
jgi:hypothetical protein